MTRRIGRGRHEFGGACAPERVGLAAGAIVIARRKVRPVGRVAEIGRADSGVDAKPRRAVEAIASR